MSSIKKSRCEGSGSELDVDSLAKVFSYLHYEDLFQVMPVNKYWEKTVREADNLWERVEVVRKWDLSGVGLEGVGAVEPPLLSRALRVAREVRLSSAFDHAEEHMKWVGGVLGPNLTSLELPTTCPHIPFLLSFKSSFPHLRSLAFIGDPMDDCCCQKYLEYVEAHEYEHRGDMRKSELVTYRCPNLTSLTLKTNPYGERALGYSLTCPQLIELCLSSVHCAPRMLVAILTHSPNIRWLEVNCGYASPKTDLTRFANLTHLCMREVCGHIPDISPHWHQLETLCIEGIHCALDLQVRHHNLRAVTLNIGFGLLCPTLDCPLLESLNLRSVDFDTHFLEGLNLMCPKLGTLMLTWEGSDVKEPRSYVSEVPTEIGEAVLRHSSVVLDHSSVERFEIAHSNVECLRLGMPRLVLLGLVESRVRVLQVITRMALTLETTVSNKKAKRVIPGGKMVTLTLFEESNA